MSRELDFADGFESASAPTVGFIAATSIASYVDDAAYVAAKGSAATAGDMYHNTTSNQIREYNGSTWREVVASEGTQTIAGNKTFSNDVVVTGDLTVNGTTTTVNTVTLEVEDPNILVNKGGTQATANAAVSGFTVEMSDATDGRIGYDSTLASKFKVGEVGTEVEIATVSNSQTLTNKTIDDDNNTISNLAVTAFKTVIGNAFKFLSFDVAGAPISTKSVPTGDVIGTSDAQVLTAKDFDGGTASDTSRITVPKNTTVNLAALTRKAGTIVYDTDLDQLKVDDGVTLNSIGSGGGGSFTNATFTGTTVTLTADGFRKFAYTGVSAQTLATISGTATDGQVIVILSTSSTNTISVSNNDTANGWVINGNWTGALGDALTLQYDSNISRWVELGRTN